MFRLIGVLLAGFALAAPFAAAADYRDPHGRFSVSVPEDWMADAPETASPIALLMLGVKGKELIGICLVLIQDTPETRGLTQADIDAAMAQEINEAFWRGAIQSAGGYDVAIDSFGARDGGGHQVHQVVVSYSIKTKDGVGRTKGKNEVHMMPGRMHMVGCTTEDARYDAASADFDSILYSYDPSIGLVSEAPSGGRSVLTLYVGTNFQGTARVLAQDVPNVAALGLSGVPASMAVAGFGLWEICEGANFTGKCRLLSATANSAPGGALKLGSARRAAGNDPRGAAGVASTAAGIAFKAAAERAMQGR